MPRLPQWKLLFAALNLCVLIFPVRAQQPPQQQPEDPEDEKRLGLWLDQTISLRLSANRSLELEFHQRLDDNASHLFDVFGQFGIGFRPRPWLLVIPSYRHERYPSNRTTSYENRFLLNVTLATQRGNWRPILRTLMEERLPENRVASTRLRFRPAIEYTLPVHGSRRPVLVVSNEFFAVPGVNSFENGGWFTQNRLQAGVRFPLADCFSIRPYYMRQSVNLPTRWDSNGIVGISLAFRSASMASQ